MVYEVGKTYLFVRLESIVKTETGEETYELSTSSTFTASRSGILDQMYYIHTGKVAKRYIKNISFLELKCTEIRKARGEFNSNESHNGYLFENLQDKRIYAVQYPVARYGQTSTRGDYITWKCEEYATKEELADPEKSKVFDEYILFSYLIEEVFTAIDESKVTNDGIVRVNYRDKINPERVVSWIDVDAHCDMNKFFVFLMSIVPDNWKLIFHKENIFKDNKTDPVYVQCVDFERKE